MADAENMDKHHYVYLWSKYYLWITQSEIANFIGWIKGLSEKNTTFYREKLICMYTEVIAKFIENSGFLLDSLELICLHLENQESEDFFGGSLSLPKIVILQTLPIY